METDSLSQYGDWATSWKTGTRFPGGAGIFSHLRTQTGSGTHSASYPMGTRGSFSGSKMAEAWSWPLTSI